MATVLKDLTDYWEGIKRLINRIWDNFPEG